MSYAPSDRVLSLRQVIAAWLLCGVVAAAGFALAADRDAVAAGSALAGTEEPAVAVALDHDAVWAKTAALGVAAAARLPRAVAVRLPARC